MTADLTGSGIPRMAIIYASPRDRTAIEPAIAVLADFRVPYSEHVLSAHRTQRQLIQLVDEIVLQGPAIFICAAGLAAHLAGVVAGRCTLPVIGIPISRGALNGMDALLATVQMPSGVPVAAVGIDAAENAGLLALQIIALTNPDVAAQLADRRERGALEYSAVPASS